VYEAGADYWGHTPDDEELTQVLTEWVNEHGLQGKRVIEFFCGEGAAGVILSGLGCVYHGVDVSPSALQTAADSLRDYPDASVAEVNVVSGVICGEFDAALDVMGFHMLVTDPDRAAYLRNAFSCLRSGAPMLFFRQMSSENADDSFVGSYDEWLRVSKSDYITPREMNFKRDGKEIIIQIPYVPGRSKTIAGYVRELTEAGFAVDSDAIITMPPSRKCGECAVIRVRKP